MPTDGRVASPITLLNTTTDYAHFKYAVQSKIYPQLSSTAIVTARGDCGGGANCRAVAPGRRSAGSAVSALILTEASPFARIVDAWTTHDFALEGQDMCEGGNLLITADLLHGHLLSFNASCLDIAHCRWHVAPNCLPQEDEFVDSLAFLLACLVPLGC